MGNALIKKRTVCANTVARGLAFAQRNCYSVYMDLPIPFKSKNNIPVVFACDAHFLPYCAVAVASLLAQAQKHHFYDIFILYAGTLPAHTAGKFQQLGQAYSHAQIRFIDVAELTGRWIGQMLLRENTSYSAYYRLVLPQIMQHYDKIIYLDADVLLRQDIAQLYHTALPAGYVLGAVPDALAYAASAAQREFFAQHTRRLGLNSPFEYFNSGVLLWDLKEFRRQNLSRRLQQCREKFSGSPHMDQDILNAAFYGNTALLPQRFNLFPQPLALAELTLPRPWLAYLKDRAQAQESPVIIHYASIEKPWLYPDMPYADLWWQCARQTPFLPEILQAQETYAHTMRRHFRRRGLYWLMQWGYRLKNKLCKDGGTASQKAFALQERIRTADFWNKRHQK